MRCPREILRSGGGDRYLLQAQKYKEGCLTCPLIPPPYLRRMFSFRTRVRSRFSRGLIDEVEARRARAAERATEANRSEGPADNSTTKRREKAGWNGRKTRPTRQGEDFFSRLQRCEEISEAPNYNYDRRGSYAAARPVCTSLQRRCYTSLQLAGSNAGRRLSCFDRRCELGFVGVGTNSNFSFSFGIRAARRRKYQLVAVASYVQQ